MKPIPSLDQVRHRVNYDAATGEFSWNNPPKHSQVRAGSIGNMNRGYKQISIDGVRYLAHRLAWFCHYGVWPAEQIDHINGDRSDNRIANLRLADYAINAQNRSKAYRNSRLGVLGVKWHKKQRKLVAAIRVNGRTKQLGSFSTVEEASRAYHEAKRLHHPGYVPAANKPVHKE